MAEEREEADAGTGTRIPVSSRTRYIRATAARIAPPAIPQGAPSIAAAAATMAPKPAAVAVAPTAWSARAPAQRVRVPYTTGLMVSTIERPQGPHSADQPATAAAAASETSPASLSTSSRALGT